MDIIIVLKDGVIVKIQESLGNNKLLRKQSIKMKSNKYFDRKTNYSHECHFIAVSEKF